MQYRTAVLPTWSVVPFGSDSKGVRRDLPGRLYDLACPVSNDDIFTGNRPIKHEACFYTEGRR
jgi:hypothetical protein